MPTVYKSSDGSAPVLTGQVNAVAAVLKACLVVGYGSKTAAGWTNPYTGTNQEVFLQGGSGTKKYFQFDDNGPGAGGAKEARMWGFETMSAYNTGTGQFPAAATAIAIRKSVTADATARDWIVVADAKTAYLFILTGDVAATWMGSSFGDLYSYRAGDQWKGYVIGRNIENSAAAANDQLVQFNATSIATNTGFAGQRSYTGFGGTLNLANAGGNGMLGMSGGSANVLARGSITFPNASDGRLLLTPMRIAQSSTILRGRYRGFYVGEHPVASFSDQDVFSGVVEYSGKTFLIIKQSVVISTVNGYYILETSTWDESS